MFGYLEKTSTPSPSSTSSAPKLYARQGGLGTTKSGTTARSTTARSKSGVTDPDLSLWPMMRVGEDSGEAPVEDTSLSQQTMIRETAAARTEGIMIGVGVSVGAYLLYAFFLR